MADASPKMQRYLAGIRLFPHESMFESAISLVRRKWTAILSGGYQPPMTSMKVIGLSAFSVSRCAASLHPLAGTVALFDSIALTGKITWDLHKFHRVMAKSFHYSSSVARRWYRYMSIDGSQKLSIEPEKERDDSKTKHDRQELGFLHE